MILHRFAADIVNGVLPDDLLARQAVFRRAEAMGIDIGAQMDRNVVRLADRVRSKAAEGGVMTPDLAALNEIGEHLDDLILEARVAKLRTLAASLEDVRISMSR